MEGKTVQDYSKCFTELELLYRHLERWLVANQYGKDDRYLQREIATQHFEQHILPFFKDYDDGAASNLFKQEPWLAEFSRRTGTFRESLDVFRTQPYRLSAVLSSYIEIMYCEITVVLWRLEDLSGSSQFYHDLRPVGYKFTKSSLPSVPDLETPAPDSVDWSLARLAFASEKVNNYYAWKDIKNRVEQFGHIIGCSAPAAGTDFFSFLNSIHKKCLETNSNTLVIELQAKIDLLTKEKAKLEETAREWTRMQVTLSFRHLLERLPPPSEKKESANWADFWKKAVEEAKKPGAKNTELAQIVKEYRTFKGDSKDAAKNTSDGGTKATVEKVTTTPRNLNKQSTVKSTKDLKQELSKDLQVSKTKNAAMNEPEADQPNTMRDGPDDFDKDPIKKTSKNPPKKTASPSTQTTTQAAEKPDPYDHAKVKNAGAALYGVFSDNIHQYTGHYAVQQSQWDALPWRILKLLTPLDENIEEGIVRWDKERLRFVTPVENSLGGNVLEFAGGA